MELCLLAALVALVVLFGPSAWEALRPERVPVEDHEWKNIPGYERYQFNNETGMTRSWVVKGRPKRIGATPYVLKRFQQNGLSVTLYDRSGRSRTFTVDEIRRLFDAPGTVAGATYNPARQRKLEPEQVDAIRAALGRGESVAGLAARHRVGESTIRDIGAGRTWQDR